MNAIDARLLTRFRDLIWIVRLGRWELTCGFCKERFQRLQFLVWSTAVCPYCGTRNLLPVPRFPWDPGPRPPNWPEYHPRSH